MSNIRKGWIDAIKGIGIILVVIGHVFENQFAYDWIYSFHMPLFFFAAGVTFSEKPVFANIKRRIFTILVPYLFFGVLTALYGCLIESRFRGTPSSIPDALMGLVSGQYDTLYFNVPLWFLTCFFVVTVFYNLLCRTGKKYTAWAVSVIMVIIQILVPMPQLPWGLDRAFIYMFFMALGHVFADSGADKRIEGLGIWQKVLIFAVMLGINFALVYCGLIRGIFLYVSAVPGIAACVALSMISEKCRPICYLGSTTIVILCVHGPVYRAVTKVLAMVSGQETDVLRSSILWSLIISVIAIVICVAGYEVLRRLLPEVTGNRRTKTTAKT